MRADDCFPANSPNSTDEPPNITRVPQRIAYSVAQASVVSSLSRSKLYELMKAGTLPSIKVGARRLIKHADLIDLLDQGE